MSQADHRGGGGACGPSPEVAAAAIRDAIAALEAERPDIAQRLYELLDDLERATDPDRGPR